MRQQASPVHAPTNQQQSGFGRMPGYGMSTFRGPASQQPMGSGTMDGSMASEVAQGKQRAQEPVQQLDDAAFEQAFAQMDFDSHRQTMVPRELSEGTKPSLAGTQQTAADIQGQIDALAQNTRRRGARIEEFAANKERLYERREQGLGFEDYKRQFVELEEQFMLENMVDQKSIMTDSEYNRNYQIARDAANDDPALLNIREQRPGESSSIHGS
jgi:hypothetical protein